MWSQGATRRPPTALGKGTNRAARSCNQHDPKTPLPCRKPILISTVKARGGVTGNKVRYVLIFSLLLAVLAIVFVYLGVPGGLMDGPTSAPGPR